MKVTFEQKRKENLFSMKINWKILLFLAWTCTKLVIYPSLSDKICE